MNVYTAQSRINMILKPKKNSIHDTGKEKPFWKSRKYIILYRQQSKQGYKQPENK